MVKTTEEHNIQPGTPAETAAFEAAYAAVEEARKQTDVLAADIYRHQESLRAGDGVCRTSETQATISLEGIETIIDTLLVGRDALLVVLLKSGEADAQSNDAKAKRVTEILEYSQTTINTTLLMRTTENVLCPYLKNNECMVYPVRPTGCRLFGTVAEHISCDAGKPKITGKAASSILRRVGVLSALWAAMCRRDQEVVD